MHTYVHVWIHTCLHVNVYAQMYRHECIPVAIHIMLVCAYMNAHVNIHGAFLGPGGLAEASEPLSGSVVHGGELGGGPCCSHSAWTLMGGRG